jgi:hypothetical protein
MNQQKKQTVKQRAESLGMTRNMLNRVAAKGYDIWSDEAVKACRNNQRLRVQSTPSKAPSTISNSSTVPEPPLTIEDIVAVISNPASDYTEIRTAKERLICLTASQKLRREMAESLTAEEVRESDQRIATAVERAMVQLETDLPSRCEGLSASKMKIVMRAFVTQLLTDLADGKSSFWAESENRADKQ